MTSKKQQFIRGLLKREAMKSNRKPCLGYHSKTAAAVALRDKGHTAAEIAKMIGSPLTSVKNLLANHDAKAAKEGAGT
jgi:DNA-directed RNA polymerase specialized sigma24 family protein